MTGRRSRSRDLPVAILTVCTGNICRSPLAEQLLRARLSAAGSGTPTGFELGSAGLHAAVGVPMDPRSAGHSRRLGGDPDGSFGTQFGAAHAEAASLILTMSRGQRDELVQRYPAAARRTFTLGEFARLAELLVDTSPHAGDPAALIAKAGLSRGRVQLDQQDDVPDPIDGSDAVHTQVAEQIDGYVTRIVAVLAR